MARARRLKVLSERLFGWAPRTALRIAESRGLHLYRRSLRRSTRHIPREEEWAALLGPQEAETLRRWSVEYATSQYRNRLLQDVAAAGRLDLVADLVEWKQEAALMSLLEEGRPALLTTWHAGPTIGIWAALARTGASVVRVQQTRWQQAPPGWEIVIHERGGAGGTPILKRCLKQLRSGGWVAIPFDGITKSPGYLTVSCLGRNVPMARGIAALAGLSGAPILPLAARWIGGRRIEVEVQAPIEVSRAPGESDLQHEARVIHALVVRMEEYVRASPYELDVERIRYLISRPQADGDAGGCGE